MTTMHYGFSPYGVRVLRQEPATAYIRSLLASDWHPMGRMLSAECVASSGRVETILPLAASTTAAEAFTTGGIMDHNVSRNWVVQLAYGFLQHSAKGVLLSQDTLRSRSDAERHPKALARFVGEHVYYYADDQSQVPDIELAFRHASALPFSIAILTTEQAEFPNSIRDCDCVDEARLAALCHFTRCILVNAYDDEGYLVWHR